MIETVAAPALTETTIRRSRRFRPQSAVLLLLALAPYDGILLLAPRSAAVDGWKVGLVLLALGLSLLERPGRPASPRPPRSFVPLALLIVVSLLSVAMHPTWQSVVGFRITYTYLLVPLALWWSPFDRTDRDRMVTILMANGFITSAVGIAQQFFSPQQLHELGYEYNEVIRLSRGIMRSFSTFNQPFPFAYFVMAVLLIGVPVALEDRRRLRNRIFLMASPIMVVGLGTAIVRGAILGLAIGLIYLGVARYRVLAHALLPLPVVMVVVLTSSVGGALLSSSSLGDRTTGWVSELAGRPLEPFGQGIGSTGATAELFKTQNADAGRLLANGGKLDRYQADNHYVKMLVELGPVGLWLFAWVVFAVAFDAHRIGRAMGAARDPCDRGLAFGIAGATVGAIGAALVATYWEVFPADLLFWTCLGVLPSLRDPSS